jgi:hypothetical protein
LGAIGLRDLFALASGATVSVGFSMRKTSPSTRVRHGSYAGGFLAQTKKTAYRGFLFWGRLDAFRTFHWEKLKTFFLKRGSFSVFGLGMAKFFAVN